MAIHVGCGSWADAEYTGVLYPDELPSKQRLSGYARWFDQVEVNSSYYATPKAAVVAGWLKQVPANFRFTIKLHRAFSQSPQKTAAAGELTSLLLRGVQPLIEARRLSAFLLVVAPHFSPERHALEELDDVVAKLAPHPLAVELRHSDWVKGKTRERTLGYFRERRIAWVAVDMPRIKDSSIMPLVDQVTDPRLAYVRLHGRNPGYLEAESAAARHMYAYPAGVLKALAARVKRLADEAEAVHVIANNHAQDFAPRTALALKRLLGLPERNE